MTPHRMVAHQVQAILPMGKVILIELPPETPLHLLSERQREVLRARQQHSQAEAARLLGMSQSTLSAVERGALQRLRLAQGTTLVEEQTKAQ